MNTLNGMSQTSPLVNDAFLTLQPYVPGKPVSETERELGITGCIKLASNENPLGPSPMAVAAMQRALTQTHDYPDGSAFYLKEKLADFLNVDTSQLILGNGSNEIIDMLVRTCMRPGEKLIYVQTTFIAYKICARAAGHAVVEVPVNPDLSYDLDAIVQAVDAQTKLLFIANPNNPTGTYINDSTLRDFLRRVPEHVLVVLDEAYLEYVTAADYPNGLDLLSLRERLVVLRTFSKCYGLAGLRVGYGVAQPQLIDYLNRGRLPFNVNTLAQVGALAALDDVDFVNRTVSMNREQKDWLVPRLEQRGLRVTPSQGNFLLVDFNRPAQTMYTKLLHAGVIVRPVEGYGLPNSLRITIGLPEQNQRLIAAIDRALGSVDRTLG